MYDEVYDTAAAAELLTSLIGDRRNYVQLLQDARRGRHCADIEVAFRGRNGKAYYLGSDLRAFADRETRYGRKSMPRCTMVYGCDRKNIIENARRMH
jgi:hypothetical protein